MKEEWLKPGKGGRHSAFIYVNPTEASMRSLGLGLLRNSVFKHPCCCLLFAPIDIEDMLSHLHELLIFFLPKEKRKVEKEKKGRTNEAFKRSSVRIPVSSPPWLYSALFFFPSYRRERRAHATYTEPRGGARTHEKEEKKTRGGRRGSTLLTSFFSLCLSFAVLDISFSVCSFRLL